MTKFLIGVATAALWFALSHAANAERICREVCDHGTCVSRCVHRPDADGAFADAVEASLADLPVPVVGCRVPSGGPLRALAAAGLTVPPALRHALLPALEAVR